MNPRPRFKLLLLMLLGAGCGYADTQGDPIVTNLQAASGQVEQSEQGPRPSGASLDAGPPPSPSAPTDAGPAPPGALKTFITSSVSGGNLGGVAGADQRCAALAQAANLPGTFRAWISSGAVNARDRITSNGPWQLVSGALVAQNKAELVGGLLRVPLNQDEAGNTVPTSQDHAWTATYGTGIRQGPDCNGWTSSGDSERGRVGEAEHRDPRWTDYRDDSCSKDNRIICLQL